LMASIDPSCKQRDVSGNRSLFDAHERGRLHVRLFNHPREGRLERIRCPQTRRRGEVRMGSTGRESSPIVNPDAEHTEYSVATLRAAENQELRHIAQHTPATLAEPPLREVGRLILLSTLVIAHVDRDVVFCVR